MFKNQAEFFQEHNIPLRRAIRELDNNLRDYAKEGTLIDANRCNLTFLVLGPSFSGKTSLLRTIQYALNGSYLQGQEEMEIKSRREGIAADGWVRRVEIKRGRRLRVEGTNRVVETEIKYSISGIELEMGGKVSGKYKRGLQLVDNKGVNCFKGLSYDQKQDYSIKLAIICLSLAQELRYDQSTYIKFFKADLQERGIRTIFVLTHADRLQMLSESERSIFLDQRIRTFCKQLEIKDREDIYCLQNYNFEGLDYEIEKRNKFKIGLSNYGQNSKIFCNSQETNFYALKLLDRIVKECEKVAKSRSGRNSKSWICGCN